jgi:hypothetical protein
MFHPGSGVGDHQPNKGGDKNGHQEGEETREESREEKEVNQS